MNSHQKGYVGEQVVKLRFVQAGWNVARPEVEARYDLILDDGKRLYRAQVKYADDYIGDALHIDLRKECRNNGKPRCYTADEVDVVVLYVPKVDKLYWIPVELFNGRSSLTFRLEPSRNNQRARVRFLKDFEWVGSSTGRARVS